MNTMQADQGEKLVATARSLFERGYSYGTSGNVSVRVAETILITPTGSSLGSLTVEDLACVDDAGSVLGHAKPSKESHFHLAIYRARPHTGAVVHLHSCYATALACLRDLDVDDGLPVLTPYYAMRVPKLELIKYMPPGDPMLATAVEERARITPALLLRNHGSIAAGNTLADAAALAEEIEEAARLFFLLGDRAQPLSTPQVLELRRRFS